MKPTYQKTEIVPSRSRGRATWQMLVQASNKRRDCSLPKKEIPSMGVYDFRDAALPWPVIQHWITWALSQRALLKPLIKGNKWFTKWGCPAEPSGLEWKGSEANRSKSAFKYRFLEKQGKKRSAKNHLRYFLSIILMCMSSNMFKFSC